MWVFLDDDNEQKPELCGIWAHKPWCTKGTCNDLHLIPIQRCTCQNTYNWKWIRKSQKSCSSEEGSCGHSSLSARDKGVFMVKLDKDSFSFSHWTCREARCSFEALLLGFLSGMRGYKYQLVIKIILMSTHVKFTSMVELFVSKSFTFQNIQLL
eukprot:XP_019080800.1 PREDICTED: uncharacterized protein LOC109123950 [Vitis vinifera]